MREMFQRFFGENAGEGDDEFVEKHSANIILWAILGFVVIFLIWASLTELNRTVTGFGRVVPSSKLQVVSNLEGGVVEKIYVKAGDSVQRGQLLVKLSPTQSTSAFGSSDANARALQAKIARLQAEIRGGRPAYGNAPQQQVSVEQALYRSRMAELAGLQDAGNARIRQAERAVAESKSMLEARESTLRAANKELQMIRPLAEKSILPMTDLIKAENAARVAQAEYTAAQAAVARSQSAVAEARAFRAGQLSDWKSQSGAELSQAQAELSTISQTLPALSDRVDRTAIRAPMTGLVNRVLVTTVGGTVNAGEPVAEIVPAAEALYIEALINPSDIANVGLGQIATLDVTAYDSAIYGKLKGKVTSISPDAVTNEDGESFYTVEIQTTETLKDREGRPLKIGPGMMVNVSLLGDKRSILSYLFTPITRLSERAFRE